MSDSVTVLHRVLERAVDTEAAFLRLYGTSATAFWLDSEHVEPGLDRFSFLGDASGPLAEVVRYRVGSGFVTVTGSCGRIRQEPGTVLDYLSTALRTRFLPLPAQLPFDFALGYVGYLGYEVKADCGGTAGYRATTPDAQWIFADRLGSSIISPAGLIWWHSQTPEKRRGKLPRTGWEVQPRRWSSYPPGRIPNPSTPVTIPPRPESVTTGQPVPTPPTP